MSSINANGDIVTSQATVACDGGEGALGHPRIFLALEGRDEVFCPYCSRRFIHTRSTLAASLGEESFARKDSAQPNFHDTAGDGR